LTRDCRPHLQVLQYLTLIANPVEINIFHYLFTSFNSFQGLWMALLVTFQFNKDLAKIIKRKRGLDARKLEGFHSTYRSYGFDESDTKDPISGTTSSISGTLADGPVLKSPNIEHR
jgi:hypothetical protein